MRWRRSLPTIDVSPGDSDVEILSAPKPSPAPVPEVRRPKGEGKSMAAFPLTRLTAERKFWTGGDKSPEQVEVGEVFEVPRKRPIRAIFSKILFLAIASVVLTLVACEVSIAFKVPWLDPRPMLARATPAISRAGRAVAEKISHLRGR
jgi:hypothetical protein